MADDVVSGQLTGGQPANGKSQTPQQIKQAADYQAMYEQGGKFKEQVEAFAVGAGGGERVAEQPTDVVQEIPVAPEVEKKPELAGYIEKVEQEMQLAGPVTDDYTGQVLMKPAAPQDVVVTLPLTEEQMKDGLHHKVWENIRWLAVWCMKQVDKLHGKVRYKESASK